MTEKILILDRKNHSLEIQDGDTEFDYSYIHNITHIEKDESEYGTEKRSVNIYNGPHSAGYVTNVKEIKEVWQK